MTEAIVGIDIAKDKFDCCILLNENRHCCTFSNAPEGFLKLQEKLQELGVKTVRAALEATGRYGRAVAQFLHEQGHIVSVLNPLKIKCYIHSRMTRNKTDQIDARLIADYVNQTKPEPWVPPAKSQVELQELTRLLQSRKEDLVREKNRLGSKPQSPIVLKEIKQNSLNLARSIRRLEKTIAAHIRADPLLAKQAQLLVSIPGIGNTTAATILAELPAVEQFESASQAAAYAGVTPSERTSGSSIRGKTRMCKRGNSHLRRSLYLPALTALRTNPAFSAKAVSFRKTGKTSMCIIGIAMHKLLRLAFGVLKHQKPFDPNWTKPQEADKQEIAVAGRQGSAEAQPERQPQPED